MKDITSGERTAIRQRALTAWAALALIIVVPSVRSQDTDNAAVALQRAIRVELVDGDLEAAIALYDELATRFAAERAVAAKALLHIGRCYEKLGDAKAVDVYGRVAGDYADVSEIASQARKRLTALNGGAAAGTDSARASNSSTEDESGLVIRRVLEESMHSVSLGAPTSDGRYLSAVNWASGNLAVYDVAADRFKQLTNVFWPEFPLFSVISPDDQKIAYNWFNREGLTELRVIDIGGGEPRTLYSNEEVPYLQPEDWSPDGRWILAVFGRVDGTNQIVKVSAADGKAEVIKSLDWRTPLQMSFSPDGRYIAYDLAPLEEAPGVSDVFLLAADGSREIPLVEHPDNDIGVAWSPDGRWVLFASDRRGTWDLWSQAVRDGRPEGEPRLLHAGIGPILPMGMTDDGSLHVARRTQLVDIYLMDYDSDTGRLRGEPRRVLERRTGANSDPSWSPDGKRLAYSIRFRPNVLNYFNRALVIRDLETGKEKQFNLSEFSNFGHVQWGKAGDRILLSGTDPKLSTGARKTTGVFWLDPDSGELTEILRPTPGVGISQVRLSPDGEHLYFKRVLHASERVELVRRDLVTSEEKILLQGPFDGNLKSLFGLLSVSPAGDRILITRSNPETELGLELLVMDIDSGATRSVYRVPSLGQQPRVTWTPDGSAVLLALLETAGSEGSKVDSTTIWRVPVDGGEPEVAGRLDFEGRIDGLCFHPDGRTLAFVSDEGRSSAWVIENLLEELDEGP